MDLDYNTRLAAIQRNEKLAQIMQQQAFQPVDIQSYQGIQAPISPLSGLAKVLQAYMGAKGTGDEERIKLNQEARAEAQQMLSSLNPTASPGRAATMGSPEIQARPATSFTPMGADFEDNPNLQVAPSGNVETPAVAYQPAVAPQAAIPPTSGMPLDPEQKRQRLVQMMMSQNPYIAPVAKLEYEQLGKQDSGPLAEYRLAVQQGYKGTIDQYKTQQAQAGRSITNVNMPSGAPIPVMRNNKLVYVQMGKDGQYVEVQGIAPPPAQPLEIERLLALKATLPEGSPDRVVIDNIINKQATQTFAAGATVEGPTGTRQLPGQPAPATTNQTINGVTTSVPIVGGAENIANVAGLTTQAQETAKSESDLVTVSRNGVDVLVPRSEALKLANQGAPALAKPDVKTTQGQTVLDVAKRAELVLPKASSGIISNLFTMATDAAGIPTDKSAADAQLRVLGGQLTLAQPRMEGPQSNADSILYQQMAASVANPNVPYQTRMKALNTVIELNEKYAATPTAPPPGSVRRITPK
jgi:hypothetical protein